MTNREHYRRVWELVQRNLLGWSSEQVADWARKWEDGLNDEQSIFYHEAPEYYLVPLLIPKKNLKAGAPGFWPFISIMQHAIGNVPLDKPYDWNAVRSRVNAVIETQMDL